MKLFKKKVKGNGRPFVANPLMIPSKIGVSVRKTSGAPAKKTYRIPATPKVSGIGWK